MLAFDGLENAKILIFALGTAFARWFAFAMLFAAFSWAGVATGLVRSAIALSFALPVAAMLFVTEGERLGEMTALPFMGVLIKEIVIGVFLGLLASLPIWAADAAGGALAGIRQEMGGEEKIGATATANVFVVMMIGLMAFGGGFRAIVAAVHQSYAVWPIDAVLPGMDAAAGEALLRMLSELFKVVLLLASPFLAVYVAVDLAAGIGNRLGKNIDISQYTEPIKSLAILIMLMLGLASLSSAMISLLDDYSDLPGLLRLILEPTDGR